MLTVTMQAGNSGQFTVVIDAGHGGKDFGARGVSVSEKSVNLAVAKRLGEMISDKCNNVKVVYTRNDDTFIPLKERPQIANKANGDLFISIHVNSVDRKARNRKTISGAEVYTLGLHRSDDNLAVAMRENSVMSLEADYTESYQGFDPNSAESYIVFELSQSLHMDRSIEFADMVQKELVKTAGRADKGVRQAGFWVLWATSMPAVLIELDFICNPTQEKYLGSEKGQKQLATAIYNAFAEYIKTHSPGYHNNDASPVMQDHGPENPAVPDVASIETEPSQETETATKTGTKSYHIQILASPVHLNEKSSELKNLKAVTFYKENGLYKYIYGDYPSLEKAKKGLKSIKSKFPEAFIIEMLDGKRIH